MPRDGPSEVTALHLTSQGWTFGRFSSTSYTAWTFRHGHLMSHRTTHCRMWLSFIVTRASVTQLDPCKVQLSFLHVRGISPWPYPITNKTSSTFCPVCKHFSYSPHFVLCINITKTPHFVLCVNITNTLLILSCV